MTLKQKSLVTLTILGVFFVTLLSLVTYWLMTVSFQKIENQRVERNIRRVSAIIEDRFFQINIKLSDWSNWDDTYKYLADRNEEYVKSNLPVSTFEGIGIDVALFIDKKGEIIREIDVTKNISSPGKLSSNDVNQYFEKGSFLLDINTETGSNQGILKTKNGILLFVTKEVYKSDGSGEPNGSIVFGRYFDKKLIDAMKDLTQFEANMFLWDDTTMTGDYLDLKNAYTMGKKSLVRILSNQTISGYLVIEDVFGKPVAIVRSDIDRDITLQGLTGMRLLIGLLILSGAILVPVEYFLLVKLIFNKILSISSDVSTLSVSSAQKGRLVIEGVSDEVDRLRGEINMMLDSFEKEKQKGESLLDLINALVVMLSPEGEVLMINKKGLEMLGYTREEVIGKNWVHTFLPTMSIQEIQERFEMVAGGNVDSSQVVENEVVTKDKKVLLISWRNSVIKNSEGKVVSILSLGDDVTQKKEEEIKKEEYGKELERLNNSMVGRELKMIEMKEEINRLKKMYKKV